VSQLRMTAFAAQALTLLIVSLAGRSLAAAAEPAVHQAPMREGAAGVSAAAAPLQPMRLGETLDLQPVRSLRPAVEGAVDQIEALRQWNASGRLPLRIGFQRPLPSPLRLRLDAGTAAGGSFRRVGDGFFAVSPRGGLAWGTHVRVARAYRLRLRLGAVTLPAGTRMWVWGLGEEPVSFGLELRSDGDLWTPSVGGEDLYFELEVPAAAVPAAGRVGFEVGEVGEVFRIGADGGPAQPILKATSCIQDAACVSASTFDAITQASKAVAHLEFALPQGLFACSGGLLNNTGPTPTPYLLTAHHCFSTQGATNTLEVFWDYKTSSCGGTVPNLSTVPRSTGGTLLASSDASDFTFVRLNSVPAGRTLLGWSTAALANGTTLYRLSHPIPDNDILPQSFSRGSVNTSFEACTDAVRPDFLYSLPNLGGTFGGSSGSPVMLAGGVVVGQLTGACGDNPEDGCDHSNADVDGAFAVTYGAIFPYLSPATVPTTCTPDSTTLCIDALPGDRRFKIKVDFVTAQGGGFSGAGTAIPLSSLGVTSGGMFWFFGATNPEMLIKVIDGCAVNHSYWVFYAATTNVGLITTVTDTKTGTARVYTNADGKAAAPQQDVTAFACTTP